MSSSEEERESSRSSDEEEEKERESTESSEEDEEEDESSEASSNPEVITSHMLDQEVELETRQIEDFSVFEEENDSRYREDVSIDYFIYFCCTIANIVKKGYKVTNIDSKLYYKLRHNLFKTAFQNNLGLSVSKEVSFSSFPELGLKSKRTPDLLLSVRDSFLLIEYTVSNKISSVLANKNFFTKYRTEVEMSKVPINCYYVYLTLDGDINEVLYMANDISSKFDLTISDTIRDELEDVANTIKSITAYFNDFVPEILSLNIYEEKLDLSMPVLEGESLFSYEVQTTGRKYVKNVRVKSLLMRFNKRLLMSARRRSDFAQYKISVNFITSSCYVSEDADGLEKSDLINLLEMNSEKLLDNIRVVGDYYRESDIFADVHVRDDELNLQDREKDTRIKYNFETYESNFYRALFRQKMKTVSDCELATNMIKVPSLYQETYDKRLKEVNYVTYLQSPFIFYPCDLLSKGAFNLKVKVRTELTDIILRVAFNKNVPQDRVVERQIDYVKLNQYTKDISETGKKLKAKYMSDFRKYCTLKFKKLDEALSQNPELLDIVDFVKKKRTFGSIVIEKTRKFYQNRIRLNVKMNCRWEEETEHFKRPHNTYDIYPETDLESLRLDYLRMITELFETTDSSVSDDVFSNTKPLGKNLAETCTQMYNSAKTLETEYKKTRLAHSTLLISQVSYSLLFYSNIKLNSDDFVYDNLGYENVLLIVKGGKKSISTRTSRFFRLLIPITTAQSKIVTSKTNEIFEISGQTYLLTPWRMLRLTYLKKGIETYHNFSNFYINGLLESDLKKQEYQNFISIKILLMFSQKRKIEVWVSTLRYIYFNCLGTHSDIISLIPDMVLLNTDSLIALLQYQFMKNYLNIANSIQNSRLYDLLWEEDIQNFDLLAERFEENLFMAKAPFNPFNEHLNNLKSIFDTHRYFTNYVGITNDPQTIFEKTSVTVCDDYFDKLESFDYNFDPKMCQIVGNFAGEQISTSKTIAELTETFNDIIKHSYTIIATGKGMRDQDSQNFWGEKGHDVIHKKIKIDVGKIIDDFPDNPTSFDLLINKYQRTLQQKINETADTRFEFDIKDKEQYKGSREIFVMTEMTKLMQNPLEKFFSILCKCFPNELIHKPSDQRPKFIHSKMFEQDYSDKRVLYCTMDCRKWAPRSNLWKYYYFVKGMEPFLPKTFTVFFYQFWNLYFQKKVRLQKTFIESLITNSSYSDIKKFLIQRNDGDYELVMPYSFMMGIFNYLSSLMHAASQLYFADKIAPRLKTSCNFLAHSDDSAGMIVGQNLKDCYRTFEFYEKFQRSLNHLMSRKKCSLSTTSFEMISIMYHKKRYIPMTHKFLTNVSLDFSGKGWYTDVTNIVGKIIDLYNNGGSYLQCYLTMLSLSEMYRKSYHLPRSELLSHVPLSFGGVFNFHPVHLVMVGTRAHECLLDLIEDSKQRSNRIRHYLTICGDYNIGIPDQINYHTSYYKMHEDTLELEEEQKKKLQAIATLPFSNTLIDHLKHKYRLFDRQYVLSLKGVDSTQVLTATLFYPSSIDILSGDSKVTLKNVCNTYITTYIVDDQLPDIEMSYPIGNYLSYFQQSESMKLSFDKVTISSTKSCKPLKYSTIENFGLRLSQENLLTLSAIEKWPQIRSIFHVPERFDALKQYLLNSLPGEEHEKLNYLKNYNPSEKEDKMRSAYLFIPSGVSIDTPSRFFTYTLLYCTRKYYISTQKPQLFTPSEFSLDYLGFEDVKHQYLLNKLLIKGEITIEESMHSIIHCPKCCNKTRIIYELKQLKNMLEWPEMREKVTDLPYVDYLTTQIRGKNIWFSGCDFDIVTPYGKVESRQIDSDMHTRWTVEDPNSLRILWNYYRIFCSSRGINYTKPVYQDTGFSSPKLAFNDFDTPYIPHTYTTGVVLPYSTVQIGYTNLNKVFRRGNRFYIEDRALDFNIYSIYDINHLFYETHSLESIKEHIYSTDLNIDSTVLKKFFNESKTYQMLLLDEHHLSSARDKYVRNGLLGNGGSLTRALALGDQAGLTRYRSSYNPEFFAKGAIEFETVEGVPVLDMFERVSFSRLTAYEKNSMDKVLFGKPLTGQDKENLRRIKNKLGLEALGTTISLYHHVFKNMLAGSIRQIPVDILKNILNDMIRAIHDCMNSTAITHSRKQFAGNRKTFWRTLKTFLYRKDYTNDFSLLLTKGLIRAKLDNQHKFWSIIKGNVLLASMIIDSKYFNNLYSVMRGIINVLTPNGELRSVFFNEDKERFRYLLTCQTLADDVEGESEYVNAVFLGEGEPLILNKDALDAVTGGDEIDEDEKDDLEERCYEGEKHYRYYTVSSEDVKLAMEETALNDFATITLMNPMRPLCFPWLGKGNYSYTTINGVDVFVSTFPGTQTFHKENYNEIEKIKPRDFSELLDKDEEVAHLKPNYIPKSIRDYKVATSVLDDMGIMDKRVLQALLERDIPSLEELFEDSMFDFEKFIGRDIENIIQTRSRSKFHLPGFQGILQDKIITSELRSLFGDNANHIVTGHVNLSKKSYSLYMKTFNKLYRNSTASDKALILTCISILMDTVPNENSDGWFVDSINGIIDEIDDRVNPEMEYVILPVSSGTGHLVYEERDIFD